ncbi:MAG: hypothetical protein CMJ81_07150 [Planctomycetaceae bacterium]|nr:hypothetical protein [Planctomycetaceae bacterium]MBP61245.1 hypothetical protein [Planctomycetaceae bacterium]
MKGSLVDLIMAYGFACPVILLIVWRLRRKVATSEAEEAPLPVPQPTPFLDLSEIQNRRLNLLTGPTARWLWILSGVVGTSMVVLFGNVIGTWWFISVWLAVAAGVFLLVRPAVLEEPLAGRKAEVTLWLLAAVGMFVTLITHRPAFDDVFYVNLAVAAADHPHDPLLIGDTMHGVEGLPLLLPIYRCHSYELMNGAMSYLTRIPAMYCFHWISASVGAILMALAHAKLFRILTPRFWTWSVAGVMVVLLASGETHLSFGNWSFVKLWFGKGVFLYTFLPLIYAYGIRFAICPSLSGWILLMASQVAAMGCSATAVWAAPLAATLAVVCALKPSTSSLRTLALGVLSSGYVLAVGLLFKGAMTARIRATLEPKQPDERLLQAWNIVLGNHRLLLVSLVVVATAWACCRRGVVQRFALIVPAVVWLVLLNPYLGEWVSQNLIGTRTYWRVLWAVPLPILTVLVLTMPLQAVTFVPRWAWACRIGCLLCFVLFVVFVPHYHTLSQQNVGRRGLPLRIGWPGLKVPSPQYQWARRLTDTLPAGSIVVAPEGISCWLSTFHNAVHPLMVRDFYLQRYRSELGEKGIDVRYFMTRCTGGMVEENMESVFESIFRRSVDHFNVRGVCLQSQSATAGKLRDVLAAMDFHRQEDAEKDHEIWIRDRQAGLNNVRPHYRP